MIFVAEVASTFNEQLLSNYLLNNTADNKKRAFLINRQMDAIRGTIFRQTMFAEFEKLAHASAEAGEPLTLERFREIYAGCSSCTSAPISRSTTSWPRVPADSAFLRAFYVYKYATGMSAAIALPSALPEAARAIWKTT